MNTTPYLYDARVVRVIDGDTVMLDIDMGFRLHQTMSVRLWGINAPEMDTAEGKAAKKYLQGLIPVGCKVVLDSRKDGRDKYGRYLGVLSTDDWLSINDNMVMAGHAVVYLR